jgi:glucose-6-phosphate 1-dehydrogenase
VRGQYGKGRLDGKKVRGYRREKGVSPHSKTETYAALKLFVDNWRWQGVPFYLRTGKCLPRQVSKIAIHFRPAPHQSFIPDASRGWYPSRIVISIQPEEDIVLGFQAKYPGPKMVLRPVEMQFSYRESFAIRSPDAYETLLWDVMNNDPTLFMRADQIEAAWQLLMPVLRIWAETSPRNFPNYAAGTWGPAAADLLMARDGRSWPLSISSADQQQEKTNHGRRLPR